MNRFGHGLLKRAKHSFNEYSFINMRLVHSMVHYVISLVRQGNLLRASEFVREADTSGLSFKNVT